MRSEHSIVYGTEKNWIILIELVTVTLLFVFAASYQLLNLEWIGTLLALTAFLFGIRYGIGYSLVTITGGIGLHLFYATQAGSNPLNLLHEPGFVRFAISIFVIGLLSGAFRTSLNKRYQSLFHEKEDLQQEYEQSRQALTASQDANNHLKKKIVENETNLATIYAITNLLNRGHSEKILNEAIRIIQDHYRAEVYGIYHVDHSNKVWRLKVHRSSGEEQMPPSYFYEDHPFLFKKVLTQKELYMRSIDNPDSSGPLICAPIYTGTAVKYVLVIRKVDSFRVTPDGLETLKWILRFVADPLTVALQKEQVRREKVLVPGTPFYTTSYYSDMLAIHQERKHRFNQPYSSFTVSLPKKPLNMNKLFDLLRDELREMDIISWNPSSYQLLFLLPSTDVKYSDGIQTRIANSLLKGVV
ncbi:hypothetical protein PGH26_00580 [Sporosarcina jeotgali]|uniref:GAF domain-containing protein n=1 Tax=Sporosarcina jeotgali TaxID=3020056 RepID=A0ABZ0KW93_9BACL|nr:hypothetical protein [Sporosarcina sp. B2O-1]WOV84451.1 hypothetical protein PGH26_00580 [Sporosarcina sp. B2O-1]